LNVNLLSGPIRSQLIRMTLTLMVGMLTMMSFNLLDTWFVARLGTRALAAISFTFPITFSLISLTIGMGVGTSAILGRYLGQGRATEAKRKAFSALLYAFGFMVIGGAAGLLWSEPLFMAMGADEQALPLILSYMHIWFAGCGLLAVSMVGNAVFRAFGNTRVPSAIMVAASLVNAVLDPLLIFGLGPFPALGIQGAALASLIAWGCGCGLMLWMLLVRHRLLSWQHWARHCYADGRELLHIAMPAAIANMLTPLATVLLTAFVARYGQTAVAAYGVGGRLESIACLFILSLSMSLPPFISQNSGAGQLDRVAEAYRSALHMVLVIQLFIYLGLVLVSPWIAPAFSDEPEVQRLLLHYLWILPLGYGLQGVVILTNSCLNALHQPRQAFGLSMLRFFGLFVPISCGLGFSFGLNGLFIGGVVANLLCACLAYLWFNSTLRRLILESP
jgi:putative MATE family efflux protein